MSSPETAPEGKKRKHEDVSSADPMMMDMLGDEMFSLVLSFLNGEPKREEGVELLAAARSHATIRAVCRSWKESADRLVAKRLGLVHLNLNAIEPKLARPLMEWLGRHEVALASLDVEANLPDIRLLTKLLLKCNTENLAKIRAYVNKGRFEYGSCGMFAGGARAAHHPATNLTGFHDVIAISCPNLEDLQVTLSLPFDNPDYSAYISEELFSMPSIKKLKVSLAYLPDALSYDREEARVEGKLFANLVQNLSGLKSLEIATVDTRIFHGRLYHVESPTLEFLDVVGAAKRADFSVDCPSLKRFRCNGNGDFGNGTFPLLTMDQVQRLQETRKDHSTLVATKGRMFFPGNFSVPETCQITLENFVPLPIGERNRYWVTAPLETYQDDGIES